MKYLFIKNLYLLKDNLFRYYVLYFIFLSISLFLDRSSFIYFSNSDIFDALGLGGISNNYPIYILLKVMSISVIIHLTLKILFLDIFSNIKNIILRMKSSKILLLNYFNCIFFVILLRIIANILFHIIFTLFTNDVSLLFRLNILFKDISFHIIIINLLFLGLYFISFNSIFKYIFILIVFGFIFLSVKSLNDLSVLFLLLLFLLTFIIIVFMICKNNLFRKIISIEEKM